MSLDKKAILKEIEVLIRSIKVHYDNIENEHRIPTIELELITSKIRKLHEKSIIYNHLHYMEEEHLQTTKRLKLDHIIFKHSASEVAMEDFNLEQKKNELFNTQVKFEEKVAHIEKEVVKEVISPIVPEPIAVVEEKIVIATPQETKVTSTFNPIIISSKIGINDRFRFIKNLFGGNGAAMEESIKEIEQCNTAQALDNCISKLKRDYHWNEEEETVIDFMALLGQ
jgi:hypothetical protein